jgi:hypothetical protein
VVDELGAGDDRRLAMSGRASAALDAAGRGAELVRRLPTWVGVLLLSALPARLLLAYVIWQAWRLGDAAAAAGDALRSLAFIALGAWVIAQIGRQFFVRACAMDLDGSRLIASEVLRVPWSTIMAALWLAILLEVLFWMTLPMMVISLVVLVLAPVGAACVSEAGPGWIAPIRRLSQVVRPLPLFILGMGFLIALPMAMLNLHLIVRLLLWLTEGLVGFDIAYWQGVLSPEQPLYWLQITAGATLVLEPFWLAAAMVEVRQARARHSGEDLRQWFGDLVAREDA